MIHLENELLTASIHEMGAELRSLKHKNGIEYMWSGDPHYWGKFSPVLFPIVGTLKDDVYSYGGKSYRLARHGFAREKLFSVQQLSDVEAVFTLSFDESTLEVFPFRFQLQLRYALEEDTISCSYEVANLDGQQIWFSVGGHPAFAVPLLEGSAYNDYYLQFEKSEPLNRFKLQQGLLSVETMAVEHRDGKVQLASSLFYEDAIVLKHLQSRYVTLGCAVHNHGLRFDFSEFPFLGIWAARDASFVCIEPWCGHADTVSHNQILEEKPGIEKLGAGASWKRTWSVTCF